MRNAILSLLLLTVGIPGGVSAHDSWVQTNTNVVRTGDAIHIDLMLGNHGNDHRDFKLASKLSLDGATLSVTGPDEKPFDLMDRLIDTGYAPNEGFWSAKFPAMKSGLYRIAHTHESIFRTTRAIKSGKAWFIAHPKLDDVPTDLSGFEKPLGHALEIVPLGNPVMPMGPGTPLTVQVLYHGKPLADAVVSFIPRGVELKGEFDERYERRTDAEGKAKLTFKTGNWHLVAAHRLEESESGDGYEKTKYSATLNIFVPEFCTCCN